MSPSPTDNEATERPSLLRRKRRFGAEKSMHYFFKSSGYFTIFILTLIVGFLIKEGLGFSRSYQNTLEDYRSSGLEYVDLLQNRFDSYVEFEQKLAEIRADWITRLQKTSTSPEEIGLTVATKEADRVFITYAENTTELDTYIQEKRDAAIAIKNTLLHLRTNESDQDKLTLETARLINESRALKADATRYQAIIDRLNRALQRHSKDITAFSTDIAALDDRLIRLIATREQFIETTSEHLETLGNWEPNERIPAGRTLASFFLGRNWVTASDQHDWYGLLPLLTGSIIVTSIALLIAVPTAIGAAIYINQIASENERAWIKPYIEFISAIPTVVIGFFGVIVFGTAMRTLSQLGILEWLPFFPIEERLNAFTAGCLLALMGIPTIFTLSDEALSNVPKNLKEASFAIGATRLQTTFRTVIPSALTGIISAIMLGFGRVIGETMIVLMCAGNRIRIPQLSEGTGVIFEPVHTMTGIIAQEMGEVVYGGEHYRALFMVGIVLFFTTLIVNFGAQAIAKKFSQPASYS